MERNELAVYDRGERNRVEHVNELVINALVIFGNCFLSEIEAYGHLSAFMISPYHIYRARELEFERHDSDQHFDREYPPVHKVT